jgi:sugar (pentulose or hexulose) kinase
VLQRLCANEMDVAVGRMVYTAMLNARGGFESDLTVMRLAADQFLLVTGSAQPVRDADWIRRHIGTDEFAVLTDVSPMWSVLSVMVSHIHQHRGDIGSGILAVPSPLPGRYYVMAENGLGGRALEWATRLFGYGDDIAGAVRQAAEVPAGAEGVLCLPWLLGTVAPSPNDDVRGAFTGLGLHHDRRHLVRATMEGVALTLGWLRPQVEDFVGGAWPFLRFGGGGAQSDLWAQALADALDRPVHQLAEPRATNARGAALLALADLGHVDIDDVPALIEVAAVRDPDPSQRQRVGAALEHLTRLHPVLATLR